MKNNIYGLIGIGVKNAMWNAGFDKYAKDDGNGIIKGSPFALQYCYKNNWNLAGEKVIGLKTVAKDGRCFKIAEKYELLTGEKVNGDYEKLMNNLLSFKDVINFGILYTSGEAIESEDDDKSKKKTEKKNLTANIRGVVQFTEGLNKYPKTNTIVEDIISPYANQAKESAAMTSIGERILLDEAHYLYNFTIFPKEYDKYINDVFKGYSEADYEDFKNTSLVCVSNYNSKAKSGCKNEFALFIKVKEEYNYLMDLGFLDDLTSVYKKDSILYYDLSKLSELLVTLEDKIESVEIYYNPRSLTIVGWKELSNCSIYDIITREGLICNA